MIYQFTGQPGHGKTLHAIKRALEFRDKGRMVYVCNVRDFDYEKAGCQRMEPADFRNWMEFLPDGAVCLVDECYEKDMLPKRAASQKLPEHVERLATHRHKGLDFIFVCQSPDKQMDIFVHDLIEEHVHVRRKFGTQFVNLRKFDRFERNPEKSTPLVVVRQRLPKEIFGLYKSTELDTTEKKIPWYMYAMGIGGPIGLGFAIWTFATIDERLVGTPQEVPTPQTAISADGHTAVAVGTDAAPPVVTGIEYIERFLPRVPSQPWSAPAYDGLSVSSEAPRLFCMASSPSPDDEHMPEQMTCTCITEQGTRYVIQKPQCYSIARNGQYEPFRDEDNGMTSNAESYSDQSRRDLAEVQRGKDAVLDDVAPRTDIFPNSPGYNAGSAGATDAYQGL